MGLPARGPLDGRDRDRIGPQAPPRGGVLTPGEVAARLDEIGQLLRLAGENEFKSRAYARAAKALSTYRGDLAEAVADGSLRQIPGIGPAIFEKIAVLVTTGRLPYLEALRSRFPASLSALFRVPGLGPKKVETLRNELGIESLGDLEDACRDGRLETVPGFGPASRKKILAGVAFARRAAVRRPYSEAAGLAARLRSVLADSGLVSAAEIAGEVRRGCETADTASIVAATDAPDEVFSLLGSLSSSEGEAIREGDRVSATFLGGIRGVVRTCASDGFGPALLAETGTPAHAEEVLRRATARRRDLAGASEEEIYAAAGLRFVPPELREARGEIEAAAAGTLPRLIEESDVRGLFHVHTTESDGAHSLEQMISAAAAAGFEYVAITDHSKIAGYAHGLDERRVEAQHAEIDRLQQRFPGMAIFKGTEADILPDGAIDFGDDFLARFDIVVASVHSRFDLPEKEQTRRLVRAAENPRVSILGHPTGRLLLRREGITVDLSRVLDAAAASGCAVEINGSPRRLDLDWRFHRDAVSRGIPLAIDPDAHSIAELDYFRHGVRVARKGWVEAGDVLNTRSAAAIRKWIRGRR
ncbi:MAG TPA: helix-hairpin-helix domain-containing protein [Thermoanaerobaculia bacterium]|nr:helix-hairpin-helix domain-containing protein [Thermoanaerobaculia bacterium]